MSLGTRLTSLSFYDVVDFPRQLWETACWPKLRYLRGIRLPGECAAALARSLPSLEVLDAFPEGQWAGAGEAVFGRVRQARLQECCDSFAAHARISSLLPSLERLTLWEDRGIFSTDVAGATRLTHLELGHDTLWVSHEVQPRALAALCTLPRLRHLALNVKPCHVPQLARLPAALEVLRLYVARSLDDSGEVAWRPEELEGKPDLCRVLEAVARLPRLRSPHINGPGMELHHGPLAAQLGGRLGALEDLEVCCFNLQLHDVAVLATLPAGLPLLCAWDVSGSPEVFAKLVKQHARRGLEIEEDCGCDTTFYFSFEDDWP